jgi:hypothetical protein
MPWRHLREQKYTPDILKLDKGWSYCSDHLNRKPCLRKEWMDFRASLDAVKDRECLPAGNKE